MTSGPLVSIIVTVFNSENYIANAIESIINQTYKNIELVIVDDGSTDNSSFIINSFKDKRIKYYYQENLGQCTASNKGFHKSTGVLIKFFDADDLLAPETIEAQVKAIEPFSFSKICFTNLAYFSDSAPNKLRYYNDTLKEDCSPIDFLTFNHKPRMLNNGLWLIPRQLLLKRGLWNEALTLINDTEFFTRLITPEDKLVYTSNGFLLYRTNFKSGSLSQSISRRAIRSAIISTDLAASYMLSTESSSRVFSTIVLSYQMVREWAYPQYPDLTKIIEKRLMMYPKNYIIPTPSGRLYNLFLKLFGWKTSKIIQTYYYKFRY